MEFVGQAPSIAWMHSYKQQSETEQPIEAPENDRQEERERENMTNMV